MSYAMQIDEDEDDTSPISASIRCWMMQLNRHVSLQKTLAGVLMVTISLAAILGNSLVIIAMFKFKRLRTVSNTIILSLSISDFMIGLFVMPLSASTIFFDEWIWGAVICKSWLSIDYIASTASIFNLLVLSNERMFSITTPLKFISFKSKKNAKIAVLSVWILSSLWLIPINIWPMSHKPESPQSNQQQHAEMTSTTIIYFNNDNVSTSLSSFVFLSSSPPSVLSSDQDMAGDARTCTTDFETHKLFKIITTIFNFYLPLLAIILIYSRIFVTIVNRSNSDMAKFYLKPRQPTRATCGGGLGIGIGIGGGGGVGTTANDTTTIALRASTRQRRSESLDASSLRMSQVRRQQQQQQEQQLLQNSNVTPSICLVRSERSSNCGHNSDQSHEHELEHEHRNSEPPTTNIHSRTDQSDNDSTSFYSSMRWRGKLVFSSRNIKSGGGGSGRAANASASASAGAAGGLVDNNELALRIEQQKLAAKRLGILVLAFLITWLPYSIIFIVIAFCPECISANLSMLAVWLGYLNSSINPVLYPLCNKSFRVCFKKLLCSVVPKSAASALARRRTIVARNNHNHNHNNNNNMHTTYNNNITTVNKSAFVNSSRRQPINSITTFNNINSNKIRA